MLDRNDGAKDFLNRLEQSQLTIEAAAFESINITDRLVNLIDAARNKIMMCCLKESTDEQKKETIYEMKVILDELLETAFRVNNVSHDLEEEATFQRETTEDIRYVMDFLLAMHE